MGSRGTGRGEFDFMHQLGPTRTAPSAGPHAHGCPVTATPDRGSPQPPPLTLNLLTHMLRPVDCNSGSELPSSPGYISKTIFKDVPQPGWSWFPYKGGKSRVSIPGGWVLNLPF